MKFKNLNAGDTFTYNGEEYLKFQQFTRKAKRIKDGVIVRLPLDAEVNDKKKDSGIEVVAKAPVEEERPRRRRRMNVEIESVDITAPQDLESPELPKEESSESQ